MVVLFVYIFIRCFVPFSNLMDNFSRQSMYPSAVNLLLGRHPAFIFLNLSLCWLHMCWLACTSQPSSVKWIEWFNLFFQSKFFLLSHWLLIFSIIHFSAGFLIHIIYLLSVVNDLILSLGPITVCFHFHLCKFNCVCCTSLERTVFYLEIQFFQWTEILWNCFTI